MGGAPSDLNIQIAKDKVIRKFQRLRRAAKQVPDSADWRMFNAGAMCMLTHKMNTQLTRFGVVVSDE